MQKRWEDWVNLTLGVWLFISPWMLGYTFAEGAAWNAYILGLVIVVLSSTALSMPKAWEEWGNSLMGVWLVISPWVIGFSALTVATWNAVIVGLVVLGISLEATRSARQMHPTV